MENSKIKGLKPLVETDFVSLYDVEYKNKKGQEKHWMVSSRKSKEELEKVYLENNEDKIDAVVICALHKAQNKLVLINQYRVPINKYIYELPAGLVDNNEDIETSVRRELKEETGLDLISINKINSKDKLYLSPGMTDESVAFVYCLCDGEITDKYQEDDEDIKAMLISKEEAKNILENEESIEQVLPRFREYLGDKIMIAHNAKFDLKFLNYYLEALNLEPITNYICTLEMLKQVKSYNGKNKKLETACSYYNIENKNAHRADSDTLATAKLFLTIKDKI